MKAQVLSHPDTIDNRPLQLEEWDVPRPRDNEVLIKVEVCGICRTDLHVAEGDLPLPKLPIIPGHQAIGKIKECGAKITSFKAGDRVGVAWLHWTCGKCRFCKTGRENLCEIATFTGWTAQGGYAEYMTAPAQFVYPIPAGFPSLKAAPLLCAGIIGYRSLKLMDIPNWTGRRIGIYGFGAAGHIAIQLLNAWGAEVYVSTRDQGHRNHARDLGAFWTGGTLEQPPVLLDAAVVFAPLGDIVPAALEALDRDGRLVLAGIHMSPIPRFSYDLLYGERRIRSVANNTRQDGIEFLEQASKVGITTNVCPFPLEEANDALYALKHDQIQGAAVLVL